MIIDNLISRVEKYELKERRTSTDFFLRGIL